MKPAALPWILRGSDFLAPGWHTEPTAAYQLMFEFLRVSPSYDLATRFKLRELNREDKKSLPADFDEVLRTFDLIGDIRGQLFRQWWLRRGLKVFGNPYSRPGIHVIATLGNGQETVVESIADKMRRSYIDARHEQGLTGAMIISLPLTARASDVLRDVRRLLKNQAQNGAGVLPAPAIRLHGKRFHTNANFKGLRLLWFRAARPQWEYWRLGAKAEISSSYSRELDVSAPRRTRNSLEADDRSVMTKITERALKRFERVAENAARSRFPCDEPVEAAVFDYSKIAHRLAAHAKWVREFKTELKRQSSR
jgi:hypothetical protein